MPDDARSPPPPTRKEAREVRLAAELRANLQRRKALTRARSTGAGEDTGQVIANDPGTSFDKPE